MGRVIKANEFGLAGLAYNMYMISYMPATVLERSEVHARGGGGGGW